MKVLVIGSGGREHALAWKAAQSPEVTRVFVAPGNAGTATEPKTENISISVDDIVALVEFAQSADVGLTLVGPEAPLVAGVADTFGAAGLRCFGPSRAAAKLEGSKAFSKEFLARHRIPSARYSSFTDATAARDYIRFRGVPIVVKADGLAAGKGVIVAETEDEAIAAVDGMLTRRTFGQAGNRVVIEDYLVGEEVSFTAIVDGTHIVPLASSQDHKARDDGDSGPNTGGMGAYSPAPVLTDELHARVLDEVIRPTVRGMAEQGHPYRGFLYAGLMVTEDGTPNVLEYNCRLGDPEAQPILMRLRSDLVGLCEAALEGSLNNVSAEWDPKAALGVVLASGGYPGEYRQGDAISGLDVEMPGTKVFHAGTRLQNDAVVTAGGRVLCVCALDDDVISAQRAAYARVSGIHWEDMYYRRDIGYRAVQRAHAANH